MKLSSLAFSLLATIVAFFPLSAAQEKIEKETLEIWGVEVSPYVRKVLNVAEYKGIPYVLHPILPKKLLEATGQEVPEEFLQASPLGKIPAIKYDGMYLSDSSVIAAFMEKNWKKKPSLYPKKAKEYAQALWLEKYADGPMTDVIHTILVEKVVKPVVLHQVSDENKVQGLVEEELPKILGYLEKELQGGKGDFFLGKRLSIADFSIANQLKSLDIAGISWEKEKYPHVTRFLNRMMKEPSFLKSLP